MIWLTSILDTLRATTPLITRAFLAWLVKVHAYQHFDNSGNPASPPDKPQGAGYGIGLALALFAMQGDPCSCHPRYEMSLLNPFFEQRRLAWYNICLKLQITLLIVSSHLDDQSLFASCVLSSIKPYKVLSAPHSCYDHGFICANGCM